jgi:hypothetical protein
MISGCSRYGQPFTRKADYQAIIILIRGADRRRWIAIETHLVSGDTEAAELCRIAAIVILLHGADCPWRVITTCQAGSGVDVAAGGFSNYASMVLPLMLHQLVATIVCFTTSGVVAVEFG